MQTRTQSATLATLIALGCFMVAWPLAGLVSALVAASVMLSLGFAGMRLDAAAHRAEGRVSIEDYHPARKARNRAKPGQMWNRELKRWEGGPCSKHKAHTACGYCGGDRARNRNIDAVANPRRPQIEDPIDAAVAAWKHVYGEDIGYNEHAVTLEYLGSLHRNNVLTSDQLADSCESVEWVTWALKQPERGSRSETVLDGIRRAKAARPRKLSPLADEPSVLTPPKAGHRSLAGLAARLKGLEQHAAGIIDEAERGYLTPRDAREKLATIQPMIEALKDQRDAYARSVAHFTNVAQPGKAMVLEAGMTVKSCKPGCSSFLVQSDGGKMVEYLYCDGSHRHGQSLADTVPKTTATEGW